MRTTNKYQVSAKRNRKPAKRVMTFEQRRLVAKLLGRVPTPTK